MPSMWENIKHRLKNYFVAGLLTVIPLATTIWLMVEVATRSINFLTTIPKQVNPIQGLNPILVNFIDLSVGLVAPVLFILLIGFMARNIVGQWLLNVSEQLLHAIPIIGSVYKTLKQLLNTLFSDRGSQFRRVVLVEYPRQGVWSVGFVTGNLRAELNRAPSSQQSDEWLSVFVPTTPNPTSGWYAIVQESETVPLSMPVEDAFKLLISGGIVKPSSFQTSLSGQIVTDSVSLQDLVDDERNRDTRKLSLSPDSGLTEIEFSDPMGELVD